MELGDKMFRGTRFAMIYIDNIKPDFQVKWDSNNHSLPNVNLEAYRNSKGCSMSWSRGS